MKLCVVTISISLRALNNFLNQLYTEVILCYDYVRSFTWNLLGKSEP